MEEFSHPLHYWKFLVGQDLQILQDWEMGKEVFLSTTE